MTPESERPVESAWADRIRDDPRVASLYRFGQRQMEMAQIHGKRVKELEAERDALRAALAASQTREAAFRQALEAIKGALTPVGEPWYDPTLRSVQRMAENALADPSPVADALGRVARASVAYRALLLPNASEVDAELIRRHQDWKAAVDNLLAIAPHWGEPRGGG